MSYDNYKERWSKYFNSNPLLLNKCVAVAKNALENGFWKEFEDIAIRTRAYNAQEAINEKQYLIQLAKACIEIAEERKVL